MAENSDDNRKAKFVKEQLKRLPIWADLDAKFALELDLLKYDLDCHRERQAKTEKRINNLPKLNTTNELKPSRLPTSLSQPIIKHYTRNFRGDYVEVKLKKENIQPKKAESKSESIALLEQKLLRGEDVFAMVVPEKPWVKCKVVYAFSKPTLGKAMRRQLSVRVRLPPEHKSRMIDVEKYHIARLQDHKGMLKITKRIIAGYTDTRLFPGIIGEEPDEETRDRYLVFLDDGSANYYTSSQIYPILWQSARPWDDVRLTRSSDEYTSAYLRGYFSKYPRKELVDLKLNQMVSVERKDNNPMGKVILVDKDIIRVLFDDDTEESIYAGSPRFVKTWSTVQRLLKNQVTDWKDYSNYIVKNCSLYHRTAAKALDEDLYQINDTGKMIVLSKGGNTARKSTSLRCPSPDRKPITLDDPVVEEERETLEEFRDHEITIINQSHKKCSSECLNIPGVITETSVVDLVDDFREICDIKVPLALGWKRKLIELVSSKRGRTTKNICIIYQAPCGKIFQNPLGVRRCLNQTESILDIDYFTFDRDIVLNRRSGEVDAIYFEKNIAVDKKTGKPVENKNICVLNQESEERLPFDFEYRAKSFPHNRLAEQGFTFNEDFKSGCQDECSEDCWSRVTCACHKLNEDFYGSISYNKGTLEKRCQYDNKRLYDMVSTGIFECNSLCSCSSKCPNRVVQNGIRFRLMVKKVLNKGWGVVTLDDIPKGSFICTYAAQLLDDADHYGESDMYYADLDYISVNEDHKLGHPVDFNEDEGIEADDDEVQILQKSSTTVRLLSDTESEESDYGPPKQLEEASSSSSQEFSATGTTQSNSRYPKRQRQPQPVFHQDRQKPDFVRLHQILESKDFTLDAKSEGNVGRFFNHSCDPNSFVQSVFIDTHDLRFPQVAFFAQRNIKALDEITWNYNYKIGCIEGRRIDCYCGASNCRGRIL